MILINEISEFKAKVGRIIFVATGFRSLDQWKLIQGVHGLKSVDRCNIPFVDSGLQIAPFTI